MVKYFCVMYLSSLPFTYSLTQMTCFISLWYRKVLLSAAAGHSCSQCTLCPLVLFLHQPAVSSSNQACALFTFHPLLTFKNHCHAQNWGVFLLQALMLHLVFLGFVFFPAFKDMTEIVSLMTHNSFQTPGAVNKHHSVPIEKWNMQLHSHVARKHIYLMHVDN